MMATLEPTCPKSRPISIRMSARNDSWILAVKTSVVFFVNRLSPTPSNTTNKADDTPVSVAPTHVGDSVPSDLDCSRGKIWVAIIPNIATARAVSRPVIRPGASSGRMQCNFLTNVDQHNHICVTYGVFIYCHR